jgi:hypothetical protein
MKDSFFVKSAKVAFCDIFSASALNLYLKTLLHFFKLTFVKWYVDHSHESVTYCHK